MANDEASELHADLCKTLILSHPDGIVLTIDGKVALINDRAAEMSGYSAEEAIGMSPAELIAPEERVRAQERQQDLQCDEPVVHGVILVRVSVEK